jgi:HPt (histidine-containing phosphotransfer) domain-containing protein
MDPINLAKASRLMDGDSQLYRDLYSLIEKTLSERYQKIETALEAASREDLEMYAHQLKGALRNVAADFACHLLETLERCGTDGNFELARSTYAQVKPAVESLFVEFRSAQWEQAFQEYRNQAAT